MVRDLWFISAYGSAVQWNVSYAPHGTVCISDIHPACYRSIHAGTHFLPVHVNNGTDELLEGVACKACTEKIMDTLQAMSVVLTVDH